MFTTEFYLYNVKILRFNLAQMHLHMINSNVNLFKTNNVIYTYFSRSLGAKIKENDFPQKAPSAMYLPSSCTPCFVKSGVRLGEKGK